MSKTQDRGDVREQMGYVSHPYKRMVATACLLMATIVVMSCGPNRTRGGPPDDMLSDSTAFAAGVRAVVEHYSDWPGTMHIDPRTLNSEGYVHQDVVATPPATTAVRREILAASGIPEADAVVGASCTGWSVAATPDTVSGDSIVAELDLTRPPACDTVFRKMVFILSRPRLLTSNTARIRAAGSWEDRRGMIEIRLILADGAWSVGSIRSLAGSNLEDGP